MAVRRTKPRRNPAERRELFANASNKIYLTWVVGIIIGALGLKPTSINAAGLSLSIEKPEIIQGIVFLVCLFETYILLVKLYIANPFNEPDTIRNLIWYFLPKGRKSFRGATSEELRNLRKKVRDEIRSKVWLNCFVAMVPTIAICLINSEAVGAAIKAILGIKF